MKKQVRLGLGLLLGLGACLALASLQHHATTMAVYWQTDQDQHSSQKWTLVSRLAGWTAPASVGKKHSCAALQHQLSRNIDIAEETYGRNREQANFTQTHDTWVNFCTCLRHTEEYFEASLHEAFKLTADEHGASKRLVIFDIGANHGQTLRGLFESWQFAPSVSIHSFEPSPNNFAVLRSTAENLTSGEGRWSGTNTTRMWASVGRRSQTITLHNIGVGPDAGHLTFYCPDSDPACMSEQVSLLPTVGSLKFEAKVRTLGDIIPEILQPDDVLAFLKVVLFLFHCKNLVPQLNYICVEQVDAQGYDCEILQGLDLAAHKWAVAMWEMMDVPTEGRCSFRAQVDLFALHGYRVFVMNPLVGPVRVDGAFFEPQLANELCMNLFAVSISWPHGNEFIAHYASTMIREAWAMELIELHSEGAAAKQWDKWATNDNTGLTKWCADDARSSKLWTTEMVASEYVASITCDSP